MLPSPAIYLGPVWVCRVSPGPQSSSPVTYIYMHGKAALSQGLCFWWNLEKLGCNIFFREKPSVLFHSCGFVCLNNLSWYKRLDHEIAHRIPGSCCPTLQTADTLQACWAWPECGILPTRKHYCRSSQKF